MLKFNTHRALRYLRSRFIEGKFLLASEAIDIQLESMDLLKEMVRKTLGDVAISDSWKVERLSDTEILIKPGEAWKDGVPFIMESATDHLVSGNSLTLGTAPVGVTVTDASGGKKLTFTKTSTPTDTYRIVITAREELVTDTEDPFLKNANLTETTAQKLRLFYKIDVVSESTQTETPIPYTNDTTDENLVNQIVISPTAAGNGELLATNVLTGGAAIDGRDLELVIRNDAGVGGGKPIPDSNTDQEVFQNGILIDSAGSEYHINAIFNDVVSTQVVIRVDKEVGQPNPQLTNGESYTLVKRNVHAQEDVNGTPQGKLFYAVATTAWNTTNGFVNDSNIVDLRTSILTQAEFQEKISAKFDLILTEGGNVNFDASTSTVTWSANFSIVNPHGLTQTIAAGNAALPDGASLVYEMDVDGGGAIERGTLAVTAASSGASVSLSGSPDLSSVRVGNTFVVGGEVVSITGVDDVNDIITVAPATTVTGAATIYLDTFASGTAPKSLNNFALATRKGSKIYFNGGSLELEAGETGQVGDGGMSIDNLAYIGAAGEDDSDPAYSSDIRGAAAENLTARIGTLTDAIGDEQEDRSAYLRSDDLVTWTGTQLEFTTDIVLEVVNTKSGTATVHTILAAGSPIALANGESAYIEIDRTAASETVAIVKSGTTPIPAQTQADKDIFVLFRRQDTAGALQILHLPLHKQALDPGQSVRLGASGAGGGGSGNELLERLKDQLDENTFEALTPVIFETSEDTLTDTATAVFDTADKTYDFTAGQNWVSVQMLDVDFLSSFQDVPKVDLTAFYEIGTEDDGATWELSRDGGNEYQTVTMERVVDTDTYVGQHTFAEEASNQTISSQLTSDEPDLELDATGQQKLAQSFTTAAATVVNEIDLGIEVISGGGAPTGKLFVQLVNDSGGVPSTAIADILSESAAVDISTLVTGLNTISMPNTPLAAGTYHVVIRTDAEYKSVFSTGSTSIEIDTDSAGSGASDFDGTTWTGATGAFVYDLKGRPLDLRVRVTASAASSLRGLGVFYEDAPGVVVGGLKKTHLESFDGLIDNEYQFTLPFLPDPDLLKVYERGTGQVYTFGDFTLDGQTVIFPINTFNKAGTIVLRFEELQGSSFDNSDQNALDIVTINQNLIDLGEQLETCCSSMILPEIPVPSTSIINRAWIPDLSQDLKPRLGIDRIMAQKLYIISDETGPNGELVWGVVNDKFNQIRFIGNWDSNINTSGQTQQTLTSDDFIEITFYGTGLNLVQYKDTAQGQFDASLNGGGYTTYGTIGSGILAGRSYSMNVVTNVVTNESLGIHTVKLRKDATSTAFTLFGFEILNEEASGNIQLPPGSMYYKGKKRTHDVLETTPYNSDFESGTLGTRGGHVLVYQKEDGSVAKSVTPTDASSATLTSANHANEEIIAIHYWREFGASRPAGDDFTSLHTGSSNRAFTLDDGATTLVGEGVVSFYNPAGNFFSPLTTGNSLLFTFVGTGLDVIASNNGGTSGTMSVSVNGAPSETVNVADVGGATEKQNLKIVSGLPYGTHTVKITRDQPGQGWGVQSFIVYGPKKPTLPAEAVEIGSYFIMADFVENSTATVQHISTGVLRKDCTRESNYDGSWAISPLLYKYIGGFNIANSAINGKMRHTFYGTGFELRYECNTDRSNNIQVRLNGLDATVGGVNNFPTASSFVYGNGAAYVDSTGKLDQRGTLQSGNGFGIKDLPLGLYTVEFEELNGGAPNLLVVETIDIITPIHSPKLNGPAIMQSVGRVGSQGILDLREFSKSQIISQPNLSRAIATQAPSSAQTAPGVPFPDMVVPFEMEEDGILEIHFSTTVRKASAGTVISRFTLWLDGVIIPKSQSHTDIGGGIYHQTVNLHAAEPVSKGTHYIQVNWSNDSSATIDDANQTRTLTVRRLKG